MAAGWSKILLDLGTDFLSVPGMARSLKSGRKAGNKPAVTRRKGNTNKQAV